MEIKFESFTVSQLQMLLNAPGVNLFAVDDQYRYVSFNRLHAQTANQIWGVAIAEGMQILEAVINDDYDRLKMKSNLDRVLVGEDLELVEAYGQGVARRLFECHYSPTRRDDGRIVGVTVISSDVTERVQLAEERLALESKLQEASQLESLGLLVGCVAHDFNNLLVPILLSAQVAQSSVEAAHPAAELLTTVIESTKSAGQLTKQLLSFSGRGTAVNELIDLNALIAHTAELNRISVGRRVDLVKSLSDQPLRISANATQLCQVITNLLINASEAARGSHPQVTLETSTMRVDGTLDCQMLLPMHVAIGDYAVMSVRDNGCGMTDVQLSRIFEPFYSTKGTGRGFGLTAIQGIVRNHKGFLAIDSLPGQGSTFRVGLPLVNGLSECSIESAELPSQSAPETLATPMRILIADDNVNVLKCLTLTCEKLGHSVFPAPTGVSAIVAISTQRFDLILLNADMADVDCEEALASIPKFLTTPVALMSSGPQEAMLISNPRVHSVLAKPFSVVTLNSLLKRFKPQASVAITTRDLPTVAR